MTTLVVQCARGIGVWDLRGSLGVRAGALERPTAGGDPAGGGEWADVLDSGKGCLVVQCSPVSPPADHETAVQSPGELLTPQRQYARRRERPATAAMISRMMPMAMAMYPRV